MKLRNKCVGITLGDPAGIGPEVVAKAIQSNFGNTRFKIIGNLKVFKRYFKKSLPASVNFIDVPLNIKQKLEFKKVSRVAGQAAFDSLELAVELLRNKEIDALVTAPVSKEAISLVQKDFQGHTEYLAAQFYARHVDMMFVAKELKTVIVTRHLPINQVSKNISKQAVFQTIALTNQSLKKLFKIKLPRIGVCGLNPHAGESGKMGREDLEIIKPAIYQACREGMLVSGPFAADTLFTEFSRKKFDVIVAMYHDQGLIPIKTLYFNQLVNLTIGLPFIRTSPAHGTAFDIVGKNKADSSSMIEAIKLAVELSR